MRAKAFFHLLGLVQLAALVSFVATPLFRIVFQEHCTLANVLLAYALIAVFWRWRRDVFWKYVNG